MYMHKLLGCCATCLAGRACQDPAVVRAPCKWLTCPCSSSLSACSCASSANRAAVSWGCCPLLDPVLPLLLLGLDTPSPGAGCQGGPWHCAQLLAGPGTRLLCPCPCCCSSCCGSSWGLAAAAAPSPSGVASSCARSARPSYTCSMTACTAAGLLLLQHAAPGSASAGWPAGSFCRRWYRSCTCVAALQRVS